MRYTVQMKSVITPGREERTIITWHDANGTRCLEVLTTNAAGISFAVPHPLRHQVNALYFDVHHCGSSSSCCSHSVPLLSDSFYFRMYPSARVFRPSLLILVQLLSIGQDTFMQR